MLLHGTYHNPAVSVCSFFLFVAYPMFNIFNAPDTLVRVKGYLKTFYVL